MRHTASARKILEPAKFLPKTSHSYLIIAGLFLAISQTSCSNLERKASYYSGEAKISIVKAPFFIPDGYTADFPEVKLDQPVHLTYRLKNLPRLNNPRMPVYFAIKDSRRWVDRDHYDWAQQHSFAGIKDNVPFDALTGCMSMCLKDAKGNVIFDFRQKLSEYVWSRSGQQPYKLYDRDFRGQFVIKPGAEYILEVQIDYDPMLKENYGFVSLGSDAVW